MQYFYVEYIIDIILYVIYEIHFKWTRYSGS